MRLREYPELDYISAEAEKDELELPAAGSRYVRVSVPCTSPLNDTICGQGYRMVDRTIGVKVPLLKAKTDFKALVRIPVQVCTSPHEEVYDIALRCFKNDRRFNVDIKPNSELYSSILKVWVDEQDEIFICRYKDEIAGFADIRRIEESQNAPFIYLAAVDEKYRAAGAAMSLYASVMQHYKELGEKYVCGRISSQNMAVMNLYAVFGAQFSNPCNIYLKE